MAHSILLFSCLIVCVFSVQFTIPFRQFSVSPSLAAVGSTDTNSPNYGSGQFFIDYVKAYTTGLNGATGTETVTFVPQGINWGATANCSVVQQVGQQPGCVFPTHNATLDAGTQLNPLWGFMFNSGPAFGPDFPDFWHYMSDADGAGNESGLELLQRTLDQSGANVQVIPAVGSPRQSSGYLQLDGGVVGLSEICKAGWTWRFLPPNQQILDTTCTNLVGAAKNMTFVNAVSGLSVPGAVQARVVTAFEYAAAIDNYDARVQGFFPLHNDSVLCTATNPPPQCLQNPGQAGLRYIHYPGWHQPWFVAYMYLSKPIWNAFSAAQQQSIIAAGFNAMKDSWVAVSQTECAITQAILDINNNAVQLNLDGSPKDCNLNKPGVQTCSADMQITSWKNNDITAIQVGAQQWIDSLSGTSPDQLALAQIRAKYEAFANNIGWKWTPDKFPTGCQSKNQPNFNALF